MSSVGNGVSKWLLYAGLGAGGIVAIYFVLSSFLSSPINAYKAMWQQQYADLVEKMDSYTKSNPNGWTAQQQANIKGEEWILAQTSAGLANASNGLTDIGLLAVGVAGAVGGSIAAMKYLPNCIAKIQSLRANQKPEVEAVSYATIASFANEMIEEGNPTAATALMSSAQQLFQAYDLPYMQQYATQLQASLTSLSGVELIVAEQTLEAVNLSIEAIPTFLALPLPIV